MARTEANDSNKVWRLRMITPSSCATPEAIERTDGSRHDDVHWGAYNESEPLAVFAVPCRNTPASCNILRIIERLLRYRLHCRFGAAEGPEHHHRNKLE